MLWEKETKKGNALYVDLINADHRLEYMMLDSMLSINDKPVAKKCNSVSLQKRQEGNAYYKAGDWCKAMEKYNESLCFAEKHSPNISLAYANRSLVFRQMKIYEKCLKDIEMAKKAGYPANLMTKLNQRKDECLGFIERDGHDQEFDVKLSFDPDKKFPCMANVLKVEEDRNGKTTVVAKEDIDIGQVLVVEKSFISILFNGFEMKCNICLKSLTNLVPCDTCTDAMFCSAECQKSVIHQHECGKKWSDNTAVNIVIKKEMRVSLSTISIFSTADEMMRFVERIVCDDSHKLPNNLTDTKSKYLAYLTQETCVDCIDISKHPLSPIYDAILKIPRYNAMFSKKKHRRFLMHLLTFHGLFGCHDPCCNHMFQEDIVPGDKLSELAQVNNNQIGLMSMYFKHSKTPNMLSIRCDGVLVAIAVRPIKKGDTILNSCRPSGIDDLRQTPTILAQRRQIMRDPVYQHLIKNFESKQSYEDEKTRDMIEKCVSFLRKYGQSEWCPEIALVMNIYGKFMRVRINSR